MRTDVASIVLAVLVGLGLSVAHSAAWGQFAAPAKKVGGAAPSNPAAPASKTGSTKTGSPVYGPAPSGTRPANAGGNPASAPGAGNSKAQAGFPAQNAAQNAASPKGQPLGENPALTQPVMRQAAPGALATPQAPKWIPLPAEHEKYLDQVLGYWQDSSAKIKRYRCKFTRWEYDGVFMTRDQKTGEMPAKTQSLGVLKYAAPDKGLFKVEQLLHYTAPQKPGDKAQYLPHPEDRGEQWICDGKSVFAFDHQKKQLMQTELPPEMQGRAIVDGPLPFMFGADAAKIKQRFWIRVITPKDSKGEYWLEAVPKTRTDAANFRMLHIIIDEQDFLPKAMAMFDRNYDEVRNPTCTNFVFEKREVNWNETIDKINIFAREFWEPATPLGYKKVVERYQPSPDERISAPAPATKQATRPGPVRPTR